MFASLPFILLLILQGFARQDCAELLSCHQDLANIPVQARNLKAFDDLFASLSFASLDHKNVGEVSLNVPSQDESQKTPVFIEGNAQIRDGFLEIRRSRDGPAS
ncbi:MAG: hypothetical protein JST51_08195 [Armatimonadetes bacterium]|nr:hypothetical protein [Armatimonadota bacterium]